jgi:hypothetical protein
VPAPRPRLTIAGPLLRGSGELHIVGSHEVLTVADPDGIVHRLLGLADGSRTRAEIFAALTVDYPLLGEPEVEAALCELEALGLLEDSVARGGMRSARRSWSGGHEQFVISAL